MKTIYTTNEYKGYGKQNYYHNEYRQDGDTITKFKCHRQKTFDGKESSWGKEERAEQSWKKGDANIPSWLNKFID